MKNQSLLQSKELRERAGGLIQQMRAIAEKDGDITKEDEKKWNELEKEYNQLITRAEMIEKTARENVERTINKGHYVNISPSQRINDNAWYDRQGNEIRVIGRDESYHTGERAPLTFGAFMQTIARGYGRTEAERRALAEGSDGAGGYTVPDVLLTAWIDKLRAQTTVIQAGARNITLTSDDNSMAKITGDAPAAWIGENGEITPDDMTFSRVKWEPKKLVGIVISSRELLEDSINAQEMIERSFAATMALEIDKAALFGAGALSDQPLGINGYSALATTYLMQGADLTNYLPFIKVISAMKAANAGAPTAFIMSPRSWEQLASLTDTTNQPLLMPKALENIQFLDTSAIPENQGTSEDQTSIFAGNFADLVIGIRNSLKVEVLKERYADKYQYGFLAAMRADIQPLNEASFARITEIGPVS